MPIPSPVQLSTWERLRYIWLLHFLLIIEKSFFEQTKMQNVTVLKMSNLFHIHCFHRH